MISNKIEFQRMYEVERKLWWYQVLHTKVLAKVQAHVRGADRELRILDAACGTGGLLSFLAEQGYMNITGFDCSQHAIDLSQKRSLEVTFGDLRNVDVFRPGETFDVILCTDALYFLTDKEIVDALESFRNRLNQNGVILINTHAFEAFSGTHDLAVGSSRRFTLTDFVHYSMAAGLAITYHTYWPFTLSLPIWIVRSWQRFCIKQHAGTSPDYDSDVKYPGRLVNQILYRITILEGKMLSKAPFGSSLFLVLQHPEPIVKYKSRRR